MKQLELTEHTKPLLTENNFGKLLPKDLQKVSKTFFTPIRIAQIATQWLTEDGPKKIFDIGAGIGKFCISGAHYSDSFFYGIEYRESLVDIGNELIKHFEIKNVVLEKGDILDVNFKLYNAFYMYNPFFENLVAPKRLNNEVRLADNLYDTYKNYTEQQLDNAPISTRLVTYHGNNFEVPSSYEKVNQTDDGLLKLWIKF